MILINWYHKENIKNGFIMDCMPKTFTPYYFYWKSCCLLILSLFLVACQSGPNRNQTLPGKYSGLPYDAMTGDSTILDMQLALADRNLYKASNGDIKTIDNSACLIDVTAHRGDFREPEGSRAAVTRAAMDNFNSIEVDLMQLRDAKWVNHHDQYTGRVTVHTTGQRYLIEHMDLDQFIGLKTRNKQTGELIRRRPATAFELLGDFSDYRAAGQLLNIEVKSDTDILELWDLDNLAKRRAGEGNFYYSSSDLEVLEKLRKVNKHVYLGIIQNPAPASIQKLRSDLREGIKRDELYRYNMEDIESLAGIGERSYIKHKYRDYTSKQAMRYLVGLFGENIGIHLDIRNYTSSVKSNAKKAGIKVYTYTVNGTDYHQSRLVRLPRYSLPDGIIVDATPYRMCQRLFSIAKAKKKYTPSTGLGKYILSLPDDADFDRMDEMRAYHDTNLYISMSGKLKKITSNKVRSSQQPTTGKGFQFPTIIDGKVEHKSSKKIIINLPVD